MRQINEIRERDAWASVWSLLQARVPVTLLVDLAPARGPDSKNIYRHELTPGTTTTPPPGVSRWRAVVKDTARSS